MAEPRRATSGNVNPRPRVERIGYIGIGGAQGRPIVGDVGIRANRTGQETGNQIARMMRSLNNRTDLTEAERQERLERIYDVARETRRGLSAAGRAYRNLSPYGDAYVNRRAALISRRNNRR